MSLRGIVQHNTRFEDSKIDCYALALRKNDKRWILLQKVFITINPETKFNKTPLYYLYRACSLRNDKFKTKTSHTELQINNSKQNQPLRKPTNRMNLCNAHSNRHVAFSQAMIYKLIENPRLGGARRAHNSAPCRVKLQCRRDLCANGRFETAIFLLGGDITQASKKRQIYLCREDDPSRCLIAELRAASGARCTSSFSTRSICQIFG